MRLDEVRLEQRPGLFLLRLGASGLVVLLKFPCFRDKAIGDADDLSLCFGLSCRDRLVNALVKPRVEAVELFVSIVGLPELPVVLRQVCHQYLRILRIEVAEGGQCGDSRVPGECVLEGGEGSVLKCLE